MKKKKEAYMLTLSGLLGDIIKLARDYKENTHVGFFAAVGSALIEDSFEGNKSGLNIFIHAAETYVNNALIKEANNQTANKIMIDWDALYAINELLEKKGNKND